MTIGAFGSSATADARRASVEARVELAAVAATCAPVPKRAVGLNVGVAVVGREARNAFSETGLAWCSDPCPTTPAVSADPALATLNRLGLAKRSSSPPPSSLLSPLAR